MAVLGIYHFKIPYRIRKTNADADALFRLPDIGMMNTFLLSQDPVNSPFSEMEDPITKWSRINWDTYDRILLEQCCDVESRWIIRTHPSSSQFYGLALLNIDEL